MPGFCFSSSVRKSLESKGKTIHLFHSSVPQFFVTHWHSPRFHAYFPTASSYPSILADMLCGAIGCIGFSWISSPACTELEVVMLDWLGELIGLPKEFLAKNGTNGGGVIQGSASDATLVTLLSAKQKKLNSLVNESHCSVERAAMLGGVKIRLLPSDEKQSLKGEVLRKAIQEDLQKGLIPFYVINLRLAPSPLRYYFSSTCLINGDLKLKICHKSFF
ncbi:Aromatic-L-amino-acid decarboxylase [Armadillidium vulgare]|nr:Aromatic-L-amino-acid decarboxylase [Armadillidium vulgare]